VRTRTYPDGWALDFFPWVDRDGLAYVGFLNPDSALGAARMAEEATGAEMEVFALNNGTVHGWAYRPAEAEVSA
jgi:hypothetical protein